MSICKLHCNTACHAIVRFMQLISATNIEDDFLTLIYSLILRDLKILPIHPWPKKNKHAKGFCLILALLNKITQRRNSHHEKRTHTLTDHATQYRPALLMLTLKPSNLTQCQPTSRYLHMKIFIIYCSLGW